MMKKKFVPNILIEIIDSQSYIKFKSIYIYIFILNIYLSIYFGRMFIKLCFFLHRFRKNITLPSPKV